MSYLTFLNKHYLISKKYIHIIYIEEHISLNLVSFPQFAQELEKEISWVEMVEELKLQILCTAVGED